MTTLSAARTRVSNWLFDHALPLWAELGVDAQGRFFEQLDFDGRPVTGLRRRTRVQARQIYVFCEAAALGWAQGRAVAKAGLDQLISSRRRNDGLWVSATDDDGMVVDETPDLYDLAFVLFALAAAHRVLGDVRARPLALETLAAINRLMASSHGGWEEALPPRLPRRQNPHMHMLEAMLAWQAIAPDPAFEAAARACLTLFFQSFYVGGAVGEFFTEDWRLDAATGHVSEPGHSEEWVWLLNQADRFGLVAANEHQSFHQKSISKALHDCVEHYGLREPGFVVRELGLGGRVEDGGWRLWAQTETIRASLILRDQWAAAMMVDRVFDTHLATAMPGLWVDSYDAQGRSHDAAAPASSLYHLMTAFSELLRSDA